MLKKKKSRVLVVGICIFILLLLVVFEVLKGYVVFLEENKGGQLEENKFEQRVFQLLGKGSVEEENNCLRVIWKFFVNELIGIYVELNEEIIIDIKGMQFI